MLQGPISTEGQMLTRISHAPQPTSNDWSPVMAEFSAAIQDSRTSGFLQVGYPACRTLCKKYKMTITRCSPVRKMNVKKNQYRVFRKKPEGQERQRCRISIKFINFTVDLLSSQQLLFERYAYPSVIISLSVFCFVPSFFPLFDILWAIASGLSTIFSLLFV